ncbi:UNVERIFIED_CONTAM: hypothetical protein Sradi_6482300 [Sesamum radiatum]|uniref:Uncharacterized protein n=1 Tax=Sesamum radiatum TaxID=300843 RepID=A0AAW2K5W7_SESRA
MVQALEAVRGGGGSVKVGTTGTISALMTRELESAKSESKVPSLSTSVSVLDAHATTGREKPGTSAGEVGSSSTTTSSCRNHKGPEPARRRKHHSGSSQTPMLTADDISIDGTPERQKPVKKRISAVAIVDIKCGNPVNPITNRLKKLGFSKSSNSTV